MPATGSEYLFTLMFTLWDKQALSLTHTELTGQSEDRYVVTSVLQERAFSRREMDVTRRVCTQRELLSLPSLLGQ